MVIYEYRINQTMPDLIDFNQRKVKVPEDPRRIISFSPAVTETIFELGMGDRLVGISAFCSRPRETSKVRKVGSYGSARPEVIEELNPDLVLTISGFQNEFASELAKRFPVFTFELPSSVAGIIDMVSKVGIVTGKIQESKYLEFELVKYLGSLRRRPQLTGYLEIDLGGPTTFGSMSYITDALSLLGIQSIYRNVPSEWIQPDLDYVREKDPDVIFYEPKMYSKFTDEDLKELIEKRGWSALRAAAGGSIFTTPGNLDFFAHHGPSFIREVLPWIMEKVEAI